MIVFAISCIEGIFNNTFSPSFCSPLFDGEFLSDLNSGGAKVVYDGILMIVFGFAFIFVFVFGLVLLFVLERVTPTLLSECGLYDKC